MKIVQHPESHPVKLEDGSNARVRPFGERSPAGRSRQVRKQG